MDFETTGARRSDG